MLFRSNIGAGFGAGVSEFGEDPPQANTEPGVGSNEDSGSADADAQEGGFYGDSQTTASSTDATTVSGKINEIAGVEQIKPRANVLDKFSSYTYRASLYIITPEQYQALLLNKKKNVSGYQLLIQSGGAPANADGFRGQSATANAKDTVGASSVADAGRNPAFPQDFYFDSITIENLFPGRATRLAHSACSIK